MARLVRLETRCLGCGLPKDICLCEEVPRFETQTRVVVVMHWRETLTTTNTGRFLLSALPNSELRLRGAVHARLELGDLDARPGKLLYLYPCEGAVELTPEWAAATPGPFTLIVPDGTWRQARKVWKREQEGLKNAVAMALPPGEPSRYFLRRPPQEHCLSTLEATARALGVLEGKNVEAGLLGFFEKLVTRHLSLRPPERVTHNLRRRYSGSRSESPS